MEIKKAVHKLTQERGAVAWVKEYLKKHPNEIFSMEELCEKKVCGETSIKKLAAQNTEYSIKIIRCGQKELRFGCPSALKRFMKLLPETVQIIGGERIDGH